MKSVVRSQQIWQLPGQVWWHWTRSVVGHCLYQFPAAYLISPGHGSFHCLYQFPGAYLISPGHGSFVICMWDNVRHAENSDFFVVLMLVLNQFLPLALSQLTIGHLLKKLNKPARNLRVPAKGWALTRHHWKMFRLLWRVPSSRIPNLKLGLVHNSAVGVKGWISTK